MSLIIDFYSNKDVGEFRNLEQTLSTEGHSGKFANEWLESCHNYIQWLFPLRELSNFNPDAPALTDEDVLFFKNAIEQKTDVYQNIFKAVDLFLNFLGIKINGPFFERSDSFEEQKYTWYIFNHNHLRITRFLSFLSIIGLSDSLAKPLLDFMKETALGEGVVLNVRSLEYWELALQCS